MTTIHDNDNNKDKKNRYRNLSKLLTANCQLLTEKSC